VLKSLHEFGADFRTFLDRFLNDKHPKWELFMGLLDELELEKEIKKTKKKVKGNNPDSIQAYLSRKPIPAQLHPGQHNLSHVDFHLSH
jgi:hypothetical protein